MKNKNKILEIIIGILIVIVCWALSWFLTCCFIKLLALLFGFVFSFKVATGVWLIWCVINGLIANIKKMKSK